MSFSAIRQQRLGSHYVEDDFSRNSLNKGWRGEGKDGERRQDDLWFPLRLSDLGLLCVCWTEYQGNGYKLCLYSCCPLLSQPLAMVLRHAVPTWYWWSHIYFPVEMAFPARDLLGDAQWLLYCQPCRLQDAVFCNKSLCKCVFSLPEWRMDYCGEGTSQCLCFFVHPARYFYPNQTGSGNLKCTPVLCLWQFLSLVVDNYSFSKIHSICHVFSGSRAFVWQSGWYTSN